MNNYLVRLENEYFLNCLKEVYTSFDNNEHLINTNLSENSGDNILLNAHHKFINKLIDVYCWEKFPDFYYDLGVLFGRSLADNQVDLGSHKDEFLANCGDILEDFHISFLNSHFVVENKVLQRKKSKHHIKETGAVYTLPIITDDIVENCLSKTFNPQSRYSYEIRCLDFASGTGRFYFSAFEYLLKSGFETFRIVKELLYAIDIDKTAINILRLKVLSRLANIDKEIIMALANNIICKNVLTFNSGLIAFDEASFDLESDFNGIATKGGFDVIFSNPPYCLLKTSIKKKEGIPNEYYQNFKEKTSRLVNFFRSSGFYQHSLEGMLNYYQLSIEMILFLTKRNGKIGIICPSSLFADLTSAKLRKFILTQNKLIAIEYFPEGAGLFESVAQSTVVFYVEKMGKTSNIRIKANKTEFEIDYSTITSNFPKNLEIPLINEIEWKILIKISKNQKIKELPYLRNKRGELDLTHFKNCISHEKTGWRLVRGNMIKRKEIVDKQVEEVLIDEFTSRKSLDFINTDLGKKRLICQQISNIDSSQRLSFALSEKNDIIANSCNYLNSTREFLDLEKLFFIMNSKLLNWRFKVTSSNNHINNYELDEMPIVDLDKVNLSMFTEDEQHNNKVICKLYKLSIAETEYILNKK